jgi:hypothetical protein
MSSGVAAPVPGVEPGMPLVALVSSVIWFTPTGASVPVSSAVRPAGLLFDEQADRLTIETRNNAIKIDLRMVATLS